MSSIICTPCPSLIAVCPSDFSGGTIPTPIPTRQKVCNTVQTATCPDGTNPQVVPAGTFCTVILNPTSATIASAQLQVNAMALAQAQSQVGDCAWANMVWSCAPIDIATPHVGATTTCVGLHGQGNVTAFAPGQTGGGGGGTFGTFLQGRLQLTYKPGHTTHHNFSGTSINAKTGIGGLGALRSEAQLWWGSSFGLLTLQFNEEHDTGLGSIGTFPFSFNFTNDGTHDFYQIILTTSVYCEQPVGGIPITHTQSIAGLVKALD